MLMYFRLVHSRNDVMLITINVLFLPYAHSDDLSDHPESVPEWSGGRESVSAGAQRHHSAGERLPWIPLSGVSGGEVCLGAGRGPSSRPSGAALRQRGWADSAEPLWKLTGVLLGREKQVSVSYHGVSHAVWGTLAASGSSAGSGSTALHPAKRGLLETTASVWEETDPQQQHQDGGHLTGRPTWGHPAHTGLIILP